MCVELTCSSILEGYNGFNAVLNISCSSTNVVFNNICTTPVEDVAINIPVLILTCLTSIQTLQELLLSTTVYNDIVLNRILLTLRTILTKS